jgi:multidrug transporter EmrE-like cation transporter
MKASYLILILALFFEAIYAVLHKPAGQNIDAFFGAAIVGFTEGSIALVVCYSSYRATGEVPSWNLIGVILAAAVGVTAFGIDFSTMKAYSSQFGLPLYLVGTLIVAVVPVVLTLVDHFYYHVKISREDVITIAVIIAASIKLAWGKC